MNIKSHENFDKGYSPTLTTSDFLKCTSWYIYMSEF